MNRTSMLLLLPVRSGMTSTTGLIWTVVLIQDEEEEGRVPQVAVLKGSSEFALPE